MPILQKEKEDMEKKALSLAQQNYYKCFKPMT